MLRSAIVVGFASASFAAILAACLVTIDDSMIGHEGGVAGDAGNTGDATVDASGADGSSDAGLDVDDSGCPSGMLAVPLPGDTGTPYCIDRTEATLDQYGAFIAAADPPASGTQRIECDWNTTYKPDNWGSGSVGNRAAGGMDWCDAYAYCKWAGKRLCGHLAGGPVQFFAGAVNPSESQWANACTRGGTRTYPYGSTYDTQACIGSDYTPTPSEPAPVGTSSCGGGFDGLFDMSGNVGEFLDSCTTEQLPNCDGGHACELCALIGGGFQDRGMTMRCAYVNQLARFGAYVDNGVRCCWP